MPYVSSGGTLSGSRSPWRVSIVFDTFWAIVNFFVLFFQTMFQPDLTKRGRGYQSSYTTKPKGGPDDFGPKRRMGGFRGSRGGPSPPPMAGGG